MTKVKEIKYSSHPYLNQLMSRTLAEKKLRPELIDSVSRTITARCEEIRAVSDARFNKVVAKTAGGIK
jgi:hypothetical protein